jgi:hypothetical protein
VPIDPRLRALRSDAAPQHAAQARIGDTLAVWRTGRAALFEQLEDYGAGAPLETCPQLARLLAQPARAAELAASLVRAFVPVLASQPLARMPFRQSAHGPNAQLVLGKTGRAVLALAARTPGRDKPEIAGFADSERIDLVLAGEGAGEIVVRREGAALVREPVALVAGTSLMLDMANEALLVTEVRQGLVTLRLSRIAAEPRPSREYRIADGALLGQAAGDPRASRHEMMLGVLGRMGRADAVPLMAEIAREGCEHLRWQALRECLALDTAIGFHTLVSIARDAADPLASPAGALRAQLLEAHPRLAALEDRPCPA